MSSLNLMPHPPALLVQAILFICNLFVVKKLMLEPYMALKARRDKVTGGLQAESKALLARNEEIVNEIQKRMDAGRAIARQSREDILKSAQTKRSELVGAAEKESKAALSRSEQEIRSALEAERKKLPDVVKTLSQQFFDQTLQA